MLKNFFTSIILLSSVAAFSQSSRAHCGTDEAMAKLLAEKPEVAEQLDLATAAIFNEASFQSQNQSSEAAPLYTIPVVVHVIYDTECDNISEEQIKDGLRVLNEDFRRQNADANQTRTIFQGVAADIEVEFKLATEDPNGDCTNGINRVQSPLSVDARDDVKPLIHWNNKNYMNIWVVNSIRSTGGSVQGTVLGYAYLPFFNQGFQQDGIVIRHDRLGTIGTADNSEGRTLTHEVGHYLGLRHTFQGGCFGSNDFLSDTPPVASATFGCPNNRNSCAVDNPDLPDMTENYMDYTDENCQNAFTLDQKSAMRATLENSTLRQNLRTSGNLQNTGITNPLVCKPEVGFYLNRKVVCEGGTISFSDASTKGKPNSWQWTFQGGNPATSTDSTPTVTYNFPGDYEVSLTATNSAGSSAKTFKKAVRIQPLYSGNSAQWTQDFEDPTNVDYGVVSEVDSAGFEITNLAATSGSKSIFIDNFNVGSSCAPDELISPTLFTQFGKNLNLNYDYAYAATSSANTDILRILVSKDCGETWEQRRIIVGGALRTASNFVSQQPFVPTSSEWRQGNVFLQSYENQGPIMVKFEFVSGGGNNFYLDNIRFEADNIGLLENGLRQNLEVYPNPASNYLDLKFGSGLESGTNLEINDLTGKTIKSFHFSKDLKETRLQIDDLPSGIYLMEFSNQQGTVIRKIMVD